MPAIKRNHRREKQKRRGWSSFAVFKSPDGVRFQCLRLSAEPIRAVYLDEREDRERERERERERGERT